jgi:Family of unknown function (DUF5990)
VQLRILGTDLPGIACGPGDDFPGYENIHVAVQRRNHPDEWIGMVPGDSPTVRWDLECELVDDADGVDVTGRHVQGRPHQRFVYLSWGTVAPDGAFHMFRRAKLWLDCLDPKVVEAARRSGTLVARLGLSDAQGHPVCAAVRPPLVSWQAR